VVGLVPREFLEEGEEGPGMNEERRNNRPVTAGPELDIYTVIKLLATRRDT